MQYYACKYTNYIVIVPWYMCTCLRFIVIAVRGIEK